VDTAGSPPVEVASRVLQRSAGPLYLRMTLHSLTAAIVAVLWQFAEPYLRDVLEQALEAVAP
jgi:hypothetical protein